MNEQWMHVRHSGFMSEGVMMLQWWRASQRGQSTSFRESQRAPRATAARLMTAMQSMMGQLSPLGVGEA